MLKSLIIKISFIALLLLFPSWGEGKTLTWEDKQWEISPSTTSIADGVFIRNNFSSRNLAHSLMLGLPLTNSHQKLDQETLTTIEAISNEVNQTTEDAKLVIENGWATEFNPGQSGQVLDIYKLLSSLQSDAINLTLPVAVSEPETDLADTNDLGINELVAVGESDFTGSPANRIVNIKVGAKKFNGLLINPGEEFSFNKFLGDVDGENGFLPELVIKRSGLVPEFGGGLCQVSSTAFRAAMNAGLPITERRNHSFAVRYYAPQGTDATIYPGVTDFKFVNDLSSHLLIRTRIEGSKLYYDFYGTKDDRKVVFDGPHQYDKQANGAMKAVWTRWVEYKGEKKEQVFYSNYQPPALFQQTTQATTPNPQTPEENQNPKPEEPKPDEND